jgi:biopolymer transport protein ExbD
MAELNTGDGGGKKGKGKVRSKKSNSKVDLTAMVDLAFLLITFFMLTTSLSKPQSMDLGMPDKDPKNPEINIEVADDRTMTVLLGEKGEIQWYMGQFATPLEAPEQTSYGKNGIRKEILEKVVSVPKIYGGDPKKGLIIIIKPSKKSTYKNLIDILDEMAICKVKTYAIVDISPEEVELLDKE